MDKVETDMKRWVYFFLFIRGNILRGDGSIVLGGPTGEAAPAALTP